MGRTNIEGLKRTFQVTLLQGSRTCYLNRICMGEELFHMRKSMAVFIGSLRIVNAVHCKASLAAATNSVPDIQKELQCEIVGVLLVS